MVRITQNMLSQRTLYNLQRSMLRLTQAQNTVSTGQRISKPSDDPVSYAIALNLRSTIQQGRSFQSNIDTASSNLDLTETTLNSLTDTLKSIRDLAVQGGNSVDTDARVALAIQVEELYGQILDLANTNYSGQSLFGGSYTDNEVFTTEDGAVLYQGDDFDRNVKIGKESEITSNLTGYDTFLHTPSQVTSSVSVEDVDAPLAEQLQLVNPNFPDLPTIPDKPEESEVDPSPNADNYPTSESNKYAEFEIYGTKIRVDLTVDSLTDVVNRINTTTSDAVASIDSQNRLVITSKRSDDLEIGDGANPIGFEADTPSGVNLMSALGMTRRVEGGRTLNLGYPATDPLTDGTVSPTPDRQGVKVEDRSFLFVNANTGPSDSSAVPFGDNLALTNVDENGEDAYLDNGNLDFINDLEAIRVTIGDEVIDVDLRALTTGYDFDGTQGNEDDVPGSTVSDLLDLINNSPALQGKATAYITADGTGIGLTAVNSTDVFKVENVRCLFGRDLTQQVEIDPTTGDSTVTSTALITLATKLDDIPGAMVNSTSGSLGIRRDGETVLTEESSLNRGLISISNDGETATIDLREAETVSDVIQAINDSKVGVEASINDTGTGINIISLKPGSGELSVVDMFDGTTARDLGLFQPTNPVRIQSDSGYSENNVVGISFPTVSDGQFEIEVRDGAGAVLDTYSIDVSQTDSLADLVKKIDEADGESGAGGGLISANFINGQLNIVSNYDGHTISIDPANDTTGTDATNRLTNLLGINGYTYTDETDVSPLVPYESKQQTASILGIEGEGTVDEVQGQNIFKTVSDLALALRKDDTDGITQALANLDVDLDKILNQRTTLGARINRLDATEANLQDSEDFMREELSKVEDADLAESISDMTLAQNAYNAALAVSAKVIQQSLLDFLG